MEKEKEDFLQANLSVAQLQLSLRLFRLATWPKLRQGHPTNPAREGSGDAVQEAQQLLHTEAS